MLQPAPLLALIAVCSCTFADKPYRPYDALRDGVSKLLPSETKEFFSRLTSQDKTILRDIVANYAIPQRNKRISTLFGKVKEFIRGMYYLDRHILKEILFDYEALEAKMARYYYIFDKVHNSMKEKIGSLGEEAKAFIEERLRRPTFITTFPSLSRSS
ncbi:hypothetical protein PMAYCL1PPCAC_10292 [Pristionchus mayeri]|uniref:Fatty acyl-CoA reductase n=1 Tax=Pristionchus mayeri TaxID=1317129 RepID=A0AAN5CE00_9BILA|nr:hypothetical protein PMAYCL1PPCAC_10292 [Pristionchus mayeri]